MGGDTYQPVSIYGFRIVDFKKFRAFHKNDTRDLDNQLEILYCTTEAYSRWEGQNHHRLFKELLNNEYGIESFGIYGIRVSNENFEDAVDIIECTNKVCAGQDLANMGLDEPMFCSAILLYDESERLGNGYSDSESDSE